MNVERSKNLCHYERKLNHDLLSQSKMKQIRMLQDSGSIHFNTGSKKFSKNYESVYGEKSDEQRNNHMNKALGEQFRKEHISQEKIAISNLMRKKFMCKIHKTI